MPYQPGPRMAPGQWLLRLGRKHGLGCAGEPGAAGDPSPFWFETKPARLTGRILRFRLPLQSPGGVKRDAKTPQSRTGSCSAPSVEYQALSPASSVRARGLGLTNATG